MATQIAELTKLVANGSTKDKADVVDTNAFDVLSKEAYAKLVEDDPSAALVYQHDLIEHNEIVRTKAAEDLATATADANATAQAEYDQEETQDIVDTALAQMEKVVPGIFGEDSKDHEELLTFADDLGFSDDMFYLTNPATRVILPGQTEPLLLGDQAVSVLQMLVTAKSKLADADKTTDVEALTATIRKEVEGELLAKFKKETGQEFKPLTSIPKSEGGQNFSKVDNLTEAQIAKLPPDEYEAYLAGN